MAESPDVGMLLERAETELAAVSRTLAQIRAAIGDQTPTQAIIVRWKERWSECYPGGTYTVTKADGANLKRLVGELGAAEVRRRLGRYLLDRDPWVVKQKHALAAFVSRVNVYVLAAEPRDLPAAPVDCGHVPPCPSDAAHTLLKLAEARS